MARTAVASRSTIPLKQNLVLQSQAFTASPWSALSTAVVTDNAAVAPDGTTTAATINDNSAAAFLNLYQTFTIPPNNATYTISFYLKKTTGSTVIPGFNVNMTGGAGVSSLPRINTDTGVDAGGALGYTATLIGSYWYIYFTITNDGTETSLTIQFFPATRLVSGGGDDSSLTAIQTIWGMQMVAATRPGDYQVTTSSAVNTGNIRNLTTGRATASNRTTP